MTFDRKDLSSAGAGETEIVALAPAVANTLFAATGTRVLSLLMDGSAYCAARPAHHTLPQLIRASACLFSREAGPSCA